MASVNNNLSTQSAKATSTAAATAENDAKSSSDVRANKNGGGRQPRGSQMKAGKKDDKLCKYCEKKGHLESACYKKREDDLLKVAAERVEAATATSIRVAKELFAPTIAAHAAATAAAVAAAAPVAASIDDDDSESDFDSSDDESSDDEVSQIGAADDGMLDAYEQPDPSFLWLVCSLLWTIAYVIVHEVARVAVGFAWLMICSVATIRIRCRKVSYKTNLVLDHLNFGDDDAFLQIIRGVDYGLRVLFFVAVVPYVVWVIYSYYVLAVGTDKAMTSALIWWCEPPMTDAEHFSRYETHSDVEIMRQMANAGTNFLGSILQHGYDAISFGTVGSPVAETVEKLFVWREASDEEKLARMFDPKQVEFCGHIAPILLAYARLIIYGMSVLIALVYGALLKYNFPVHYRPDSVRYFYVGPHVEYDRIASLGDCRDASFRSVKVDSPDYVARPEYLIYDVVSVVNNVLSKRRVVISNAIFNIFHSPLNTGRWVEIQDFEKMRKDTAAFARAALQRVNISTAIEKADDVCFETATLFAWKMKTQRMFPTNFWTPEIE